MRFGCFFFRNFPIQIEVRDDNSLSGKPIIIGGLPYQRKSVYASSHEAFEHGIKQGMPLREAYSLCPQGLFLPLDEEKYLNAFTAVLTLLANYSPAVEAGL
jgi:nucleotidyltransferase/DNA polymerase involved in DNA repair